VQQHIDATQIQAVTQFVEINPETLKLIKEKQSAYNTKVINLVKSIEKAAEDASDDPYLAGMAERAKAVQESYEDRQTSTADAIDDLMKEIEANERRKKEQAEKGFDGLTYFVYAREVHQKMTFAIFPEEDDFDKVVAVVDRLLTLLRKAQEK